MSDKNGKKFKSIKIPIELHTRFKTWTAERKRKIRETVIEALEEKIK